MLICTASFLGFITISKVYTCITAHTKGQKAFSGNSDLAFMTRGFLNWKKCSERSLDHPNSIIHKNYEDLVQLDEANIDTDNSSRNSYH